MNADLIRGLCYIVASVFFIFGLKMLSSQRTARRGNLLSALGMLLAVVTTLTAMEQFRWAWVIVGAVLGGAIGASAARLVKMTSMPEMVGLFNGFGGLASLLVGWSEFHWQWGETAALGLFTTVAILLTVLIGGVTFSGSVVAYGKLSARLTGKPILFKGQNVINAAILVAIVVLGILFVGAQHSAPSGSPASQTQDVASLPARAGGYLPLMGIVVLALALGVLSTIPIGGADMPVVICLLNSYSGLAACAAGFVIGNNVLIVSGSFVGASGIILTRIMCKAMNRSLANVLFSGFGSATSAQTAGYQGEAKPISPEDTYLILEAARNVVFVPGYGMAAAQAQHVVRELGELLQKNGAEVRYCIHPVAGRMPGHMNVLLAEANVPYEQLVEPQDVNPNIELVDVVIVIGANDVVNPAARDDQNSPLWGMPIIEVDRARTCIVLKRSLNPGFAGVDNPLFFCPNTRMLFGDAKASVTAVVAEFKQ
ncbi:MAG: NAD(P)(+) transhydrogenase (Re/Si-specific) subunit beta [Sedimentisphaerales bacterium]|nr:NAD(P)(+) transhydrogenase (Re/Si-specific) subunit beta [Sedimentisphaerales bacterium]